MKKVNKNQVYIADLYYRVVVFFPLPYFYLGFHELMPKTIKYPKDLLLYIIRRDTPYNIVFQRVRVVDSQCPLPCNR